MDYSRHDYIMLFHICDLIILFNLNCLVDSRKRISSENVFHKLSLNEHGDIKKILFLILNCDGNRGRCL